MESNKLEMYISSSLARIKKIVIKDKYTLLFSFIFSFIYVLPLLLANVYYRDDLRRSVNGLGWAYDGRDLSTFIMTKLTGGSYITDYFPFSQIFAAIIVAISGYILISIIGLEKGRKVKLSSLILLINPFFLENLSYRWDSIPMAISVFAVILPFLYVSSNWRFLLFSVIGICATMLTYQASAPVFILMALIVLIDKCIKGGKGLLRYIILFGSGFLLGLIVYKLMTFGANLGDRASIIPLDENFFDILSHNISLINELIKSAFSTYFAVLMALSILLALSGFIKFLISDSRLLYVLLVPIFSLCVIIIMPITILVLKEVWVGARLLVTFPFLIYLIFIFVNYLSQKIVPVLSVLFILLSFALVSSYANSLKAQNTLETRISQEIGRATDIKNKEIIFIGKIEYAAEADGAIEKYPLFKYIVPSYLDHAWGLVYLPKMNSYISAQPSLEMKDWAEIIKNKDSVPIVDENFYYVLRANSTEVIIDFNASLSKQVKINVP